MARGARCRSPCFATFDDAFLGREDAGLFYGGGIGQLSTQALFILAHFIFVTVTAGLLFLAIKKTIGLRVSEEEELAGLDVLEHGAPGYSIEQPHGTGYPVAAGMPVSERV